MNKNPISEAAARLGRRGLGKPKRVTEADRQRRREWAAGLQARRKAQKLSRFTVIIDAVAGKAAI